jgi:hypothetical protein
VSRRTGVSSDGAADAGGVWILTALVLGLIVYAGIVVMAIAGFGAVIPLVVIPPVLVALIGASSLIGGGRTHGQPSGGPVDPGRAPLSSSGPNGKLKPEIVTAVESTAPEESSEPR